MCLHKGVGSSWVSDHAWPPPPATTLEIDLILESLSISVFFVLNTERKTKTTDFSLYEYLLKFNLKVNVQ